MARGLRMGSGMMTNQTEVDVLIVGAGPTGLTAAARLAQAGVSHAIVDASPGPTLESRAGLVHAATLEMFDRLGIGDELVAAGRRLRAVVIRDRGHVLMRVDMTRIPSKYAFALAVPQSTTEAILIRRVGELGGSIRRDHHVESLRQIGDRYVVTGTIGRADSGGGR